MVNSGLNQLILRQKYRAIQRNCLGGTGTQSWTIIIIFHLFNLFTLLYWIINIKFASGLKCIFTFSYFFFPLCQAIWEIPCRAWFWHKKISLKNVWTSTTKFEQRLFFDWSFEIAAIQEAISLSVQSDSVFPNWDGSKIAVQQVRYELFITLHRAPGSKIWTTTILCM